MDHEQRLIRIEEQITHLQREVAELNDVIRQLTDDQARTRKELRAVEENLHEHLSDSTEHEPEQP